MALLLRQISLRPERRRIAAFVLGVVACGVACFQGARAPNVPPRTTLELTQETTFGRVDGPFAVVFASPRGPTYGQPELSIVFNRPVGALTPDAQVPDIRITPPVEGHFVWVGSQALTFLPKQAFPAATEVRVEVPSGITAISGETLSAPFQFSFSTERPRVISTAPRSGADDLTPEAKIELRTSQPVDAAALARVTTLTVTEKNGAPSAVPFEVTRKDPDNETTFVVAPQARLPLEAEVKLEVGEELAGKQGPLKAGSRATFTFETYGPLKVEQVSCGYGDPKTRCRTDGSFEVALSNPVRVAALKKAISVDPPVKLRFSSWQNDDEKTKTLWFSGEFKPSGKYRVTVAAGALSDEHGQSLASGYSTELTTADLDPDVGIGVSGLYLDGQSPNIPIALVNTKDVDIATAPLSMDDVTRWFGGKESFSIDFADIAKHPAAVVRRTPSGAKNQVARSDLATSAVLGKGKHGAMAVALAYDGTGNLATTVRYDTTRIVQVTDLALSAKVSPHGSLVWVTRLSTGAPVPGANVVVRADGGAQSSGSASGSTPVHTTDADGIVMIPASEFVPKEPYAEEAVLFASLGDDWTFRPVREVLDQWRFGVGFQFDEEPLGGLLFTDTGLYRTGDTVRVKGILREPTPKGWKTPSNTNVVLDVRSPTGERFAEVRRPLSAFGTFDADIVIPETAKRGGYQMEAREEDHSDRGAVTGTFEVADYRAAEIRVSAGWDKPYAVRGDKVRCDVRGEYLYGAPMPNAPTSVSFSRTEAEYALMDAFEAKNADVKGIENFVLSDRAFKADLPEKSADTALEGKDGTLSAAGALGAEVTLTGVATDGPEHVICDAEVTDVSRQAGSASALLVVYPADTVLALEASPTYFVDGGKPVSPRVLALDLDGNKRSGVAVKIDLVERSWTVARQKDAHGDLRTVSVPQDKVVASCNVTTGAVPASCALTPPDAGYFLVHATATDSRKNAVGASDSVYALGEGSAGWRESDPQAVELVPSQDDYKVGDTAKVLVKSPFPSAEALVTVERSGVYTKRRVTLKGSAPTIEVPITEDLVPNAYVSVLLVRGRSKARPSDPKGADAGAPVFRFGAVELAIDASSRRLDVDVGTDKQTYKPGEMVTANVRVKNSAGAPERAEVTIYAVDEGVLALTAYETPDPFDRFSKPRPLQVATIESREAMARLFTPLANLGADKGGTGGGGGVSGTTIRRDFRASAFYAPAVVTDAAGHAEVRFKLPDTLTAYRVMAVATGATDRFGAGEHEITVSQPLMARPAFPRFLRAGDTFEAGVIVSTKANTESAPSAVEIEASVTGTPAAAMERAEAPRPSSAVMALVGPVSTLGASDPLRGPAPQTSRMKIDLTPGVPREVRFAFETRAAGRAAFRFVVRGGGEEDRVEITRRIDVPGVIEAVAVHGDTTTAITEQLGDLSQIRSDVGDLSLSLASTGLVGLSDGVEQLIEYPYGCTEQLTSRLVPLLPLQSLARDFGFPLPKEKELRAAVSKAVVKILSHQRDDGGFGLWAESDHSSAWLTAYALWGLHHAKRSGIAVPEDAERAALSYLSRERARGRLAGDVDRASVPFVLDVLAERGQPEIAEMNAAFDARKSYPLFAQAELLHAFAITKRDPKDLETLVSEIEGQIRIDGPGARAVSAHGDAYAAVFDSDMRTTALVLRGLVAAQPGHPLVTKLVRGLMDARRGGTWRTTQETAWALLALDDYRRAREKEAPSFIGRVFVGQEEVFEHPFEGRSLAQVSHVIPASEIAGKSRAMLGFSADGDGALFYEARLKYVRRELSVSPLDRGFFVTKSLRKIARDKVQEAIDARGAASSTTFAAGDLVLGEVVVVTPSPRRWVVIDDPLPAGFEAVDARLATTRRPLDPDAADRADDEGDDEEDRFSYAPERFVREIRDDRVLFFVDEMASGLYRYRYLARATGIGSFVVPPTKAEEMYAPEVHGRTGAVTVTVASAGPH